MFVEFDKDAPTGQTKAFAVNVDNVLKIEPSMGQPTTVLTYVDGTSDVVLGDLQITIKRLNGEITDVTSIG